MRIPTHKFVLPITESIIPASDQCITRRVNSDPNLKMLRIMERHGLERRFPSQNFNPYAVLQDIIPQKRRTERKSGSNQLTLERVPIVTRRTGATGLREKPVVCLPLPANQKGQQGTKIFENATSEEDFIPPYDSSQDENGDFDPENTQELLRLVEKAEMDPLLSSSGAPHDFDPIP
jgi:hypothetical protein